MHIFVSDLHMTDTDAAGAVSDAELSTFADRLELLTREKNKPITLVFAGDILELLRSPKWQAIWTQHKSAPWSGVGKRFRNFANGHAETCAIEVAKAIQQRYAGFSAKLRALVELGKLETKYIYGNHDYMVQLSPGLRRILVDILALAHDPEKEFTYTYDDPGASVFAAHGHTVDLVNWHRKTDGYWAMGDAIVLRVVNRFPAAACDAISVALTTRIGQDLQEIENVEQVSEVPLYVRWLAEEFPRDQERMEKNRQGLGRGRGRVSCDRSFQGQRWLWRRRIPERPKGVQPVDTYEFRRPARGSRSAGFEQRAGLSGSSVETGPEG
jgi:UDP-2,3-diacylglucosamine pyrophosphatase LpxH